MSQQKIANEQDGTLNLDGDIIDLKEDKLQFDEDQKVSSAKIKQ